MPTVFGLTTTKILALLSEKSDTDHTHETGTVPSHQHSAPDINSGILDAARIPIIRQAINAQTGTSYTPVASDAMKLVTLTNAAAITLTIPPNVFVAGDRIDFSQRGEGAVTTVQGSGMTLRSMPGMTLISEGQYASWTVRFLSATEADVVGWLVPE